MTEHLEHSMQHHQKMETSQVMTQQWEQSPFMLMEHGIEVLKNMRRPLTPSESALAAMPETEVVGLERDYRELRKTLMQDHFVIIAIGGRQKAAKGDLARGFTDLAQNDMFLKNWAAKEEVDVSVEPVLFAHTAYAAQLDSIRTVDPNVKPQDLTREHTKGISELMRHMVVSHALPRGTKTKEEVTQKLKDQKKAVLVIVETTAPVSYPDPEVAAEDQTIPPKMVGEFDWGNSAFVGLALDPKTKDNTIWYMVNKDKDLQEDPESTEFRTNLMSPNPDLKKIFGGTIRPTVTLDSGETVDVIELPEEEQRKHVGLLRISMAPAQNVERNDVRVDTVVQHLHKNGLIPEPTDEAYFEYFRQKMNVPKGKFRIINNPWLGGPKSYSLNYLKRSLVLRGHPGILADAIQNVVAPPTTQDSEPTRNEQNAESPASVSQAIAQYLDSLQQIPLETEASDESDTKRQEAISLAQKGLSVIQKWALSNTPHDPIHPEDKLGTYQPDSTREFRTFIKTESNQTEFSFTYTDTTDQMTSITIDESGNYSLFIEYRPEARRPIAVIYKGENLRARMYSPMGDFASMKKRDAQFLLYFIKDFIKKFVEGNNKSIPSYAYLFLAHNDEKSLE